MDNGVTSEMISCAVDEQSWRLELKTLLRGKLLPIIVSANRPGDDVPPVMELMKELAAARKSAQDMHKKCQRLEAQVANLEKSRHELAKGSRGFNEGMHYANRINSEHAQKLREEMQKEFERKLAAYKDATRGELKALRHGSCPSAYLVAHTDADGKKSTPHVLLSYHRPSPDEIAEACGYATGGDISCSPLLVPLVPPNTK